jgi:hypothetical protein
LRERFPALDRSINRFGYWWAVFGPGGVLSVLMGWAASAVQPIRDLGWGAIAFVGVGSACVIMLVASAMLVAWRYFNPISIASDNLGEADKAPLDASALSKLDSGWKKAFFEFGKHVDDVIGEQEKLRIEFAAIAPVAAQLQHLRRTAFLLSTAAISDHYKRKLREGLDWWEKHPRTGPFTTDFEIRTEVMRVQEFINDLQANLAPSHWTAELYSVVQNAERDADHEVMKKKTAPDGLSPFEYRRFHIACTQYERIGAFLQRSVEEAKGHEAQMIQMLRERPDLHK